MHGITFEEASEVFADPRRIDWISSDPDQDKERWTTVGLVRMRLLAVVYTARPLDDRSDWARVDAMTDEEAYQNALDDPDNPPLTPKRLTKMRRVPKPERLRRTLGLTQEEFARQFEITLGTLRAWEDGSRHMDRTAVSYLTVIEKNPDAVRQALSAEQSEHALAAEDDAAASRRRAG